MDNPYLFLNIDPLCTDEELEARYAEMKAQFSEDRFLEGEAGRAGAENLTRLEECYREAKRRRSDASFSSDGGDGLDVIDRLIKDGRLDEAQQSLDGMSVRDGRWHYLQAIVFYKRNWFTDSLRQLDIALSLEPDNAQYKHSKEILERTVNGTPNPGAYGQGGQQTPPPPQPAPDDAMGMGTCCQTLCCMDCLCNTMRCAGCG